jgi:hypothetical protein
MRRTWKALVAAGLAGVVALPAVAGPPVPDGPPVTPAPASWVAPTGPAVTPHPATLAIGEALRVPITPPPGHLLLTAAREPAGPPEFRPLAPPPGPALTPAPLTLASSVGPAVTAAPAGLVGTAGPSITAAPASLAPAGSSVSERPASLGMIAGIVAPLTPAPSHLQRAGALEPIDPVTELPPLTLPPPTKPGPEAVAPPPSGPPQEYDPSHWYLPDCLPNRMPAPPPPCGVPGRVWVIADYLDWSTARDRPALLAALAPTGDRTGEGLRSGFRIDSGAWLDCAQTCGIELGCFTLGTGTRTDNLPPSAAALTATASTDLIGAEANLRANLVCSPHFRLDLLGGYRFLDLSECFGVTAASGDLEVDTELTTRNQFHGGQLGLTGGARYGRLFADLTGKLALGVTREQAVVTAYAAVPAAGLALPPTRLGLARASEFAVLPEADFTVGMQVSDRLRASAGYTFLYLSRAARPGELADRLLSGQAGALSELRAGDFWAQGLNLGLEYRY